MGPSNGGGALVLGSFLGERLRFGANLELKRDAMAVFTEWW